MAPRVSGSIISQAQFELQDREWNRRKKRASRPGQKAPGNRTGYNGSQKRNRQDIDSGDDEDLADVLASCARDGDSEWKQRQQRKLQSFAEKRPVMKQRMQQYTAAQEGIDQMEQLQQLTQHLDTRVAAAIMRHQCHAVLSAAELQQLLQSQTDDSQQYGAVTIVSRRVVAVHELGASIWLSAPTCRCSCCHDDWEVLPAADVALTTHGCGSPISYCSIYTSLKFSSGTGSSSFADACSCP